ncbi:iron complex outermembrane receptor protein [Duganella sp. 1224]|uniref:TonB-dependent receptor n=1 Tax=Duganella sp. 1224 TaxID=2587052 RepID=UPI0015CBCCED|nr:TonB-dependent receptor [Duganella sp. 1224]NYE61720.1 iron complex outermembrane receptor protein [Duganella sp. 1224]
MRQRFPLKPLCLVVLQALACQAYAGEATDTAADDSAAVGALAGPVQTVEITGRGQSRQVQNINKLDLAEALPGTSPLKVLDKLPGVNFQSADPFGAYEWSTSFSIRGFNQSQLGYTLDGVPLGDMSYGNNNGLHISRAISSENIGSVQVSQGAGSLGTASSSNLGGTVQFFTLAPSDERGLTFAQTGGSDSTSRTFVRVDSGLINGVFKAFLSGTRQRTDKWKGDGGQDQDQWNSRFVFNFGDNSLTGFLNYSDRKEIDYQDMSLEMINRLGYNWDNYQPDWQRAVNAAKGIYTGGVNSLDDAYYSAGGLRKDTIGGLTLDLHLSQNVDLKTTIYHHDNKGQGHWYTPYVPTNAANPISLRTTEYSIYRDGVTSDLSWEIGDHTISAGLWGERNNHTASRNYYGVTGPADTMYYLSNPFATDWKQNFITTTSQYYLQDTLALLDNKLKINAGFKALDVDIHATNIVGTRAAGDLDANKKFLPQAGFNYAVTADDEVFGSASKNMRAFQPGVGGPFSQTQAAYNAGIGNLRPETSTNVDLGYRFKRASLQGSVALYSARFDDRQLSVATCAGIVGCPSTFVNVGKVDTKGAEAVAVWKFNREFSWFNSYTYNDSKYKSNYVDGTTLVAVSGKTVVNAPRQLFNTEVSYEGGAWFARLGAKYTGKRYYTYLNDAGVEAFWLSNLSAGYKLKSLGWAKELSLQLNVTNLFDKQYISTIGTNGFQASDPKGTAQTLLTGAPRQFFLTLNGKL